MVKLKWGLDARQHITKESYYALEKLQVLSRNYTIDYEEYRNRQQVWCTSWSAVWSGSSHCTSMTHYGNKNALGSNPNIHQRYYCSSDTPDVGEPSVINDIATCYQSWYQSYGQYKTLFRDVGGDVDDVLWAVKDDDDIDLGDWPMAIMQSTGVQELYLISHDRSHRLLLRKKLIEQWDWDRNWLTGDSDTEKLYTLQILQLRWLDAWEAHDFQSSGTYDGQIDTWTCDAGLWYTCQWSGVGWAYSGYVMPATADDWWINLLSPDITVSDRNIAISPVKDTNSAWNWSLDQVSPHISIAITTKLYGKNWSGKIPRSQMNIYSLRLQTLLSLPTL